jgi:hypothetical protein
LAGTGAADALHEAALAATPLVQLDRRQFGIQAGKQPIREALLQTLPPRGRMLKRIARDRSRALRQIGFELLARGCGQDGVLDAQHCLEVDAQTARVEIR